MLEFWYKALMSPYGIELDCSDAEKVRQKLYAIRRETKDLDLNALGLFISPFDPQKLWIIKKP